MHSKESLIKIRKIWLRSHHYVAHGNYLFSFKLHMCQVILQSVNGWWVKFNNQIHPLTYHLKSLNIFFEFQWDHFWGTYMYKRNDQNRFTYVGVVPKHTHIHIHITNHHVMTAFSQYNNIILLVYTRLHLNGIKRRTGGELLFIARKL